MTTERHPGTSPVFRHFRELASLPADERHAALMERLEHVWELAEGRCYTNKHGDEIAMPDTAVMLKCVQAVAVLHANLLPSDDEAAQLERMSPAELVREATKQLPPAQLNELADALIALREQQRVTVLTTGENSNAPEENGSERQQQQRTETDGSGAAKPRAKWAKPRAGG